MHLEYGATQRYGGWWHRVFFPVRLTTLVRCGMMPGPTYREPGERACFSYALRDAGRELVHRVAVDLFTPVPRRLAARCVLAVVHRIAPTGRLTISRVGAINEGLWSTRSLPIARSFSSKALVDPHQKGTSSGPKDTCTRWLISQIGVVRYRSFWGEATSLRLNRGVQLGCDRRR